MQRGSKGWSRAWVWGAWGHCDAERRPGFDHGHRVTAATLTSLIVTPANPSLAMGTTLQMTATAVFSDGTTQNVTSQVDWTSSNETVAHHYQQFITGNQRSIDA
jgi:hypothetical protein